MGIKVAEAVVTGRVTQSGLVVLKKLVAGEVDATNEYGLLGVKHDVLQNEVAAEALAPALHGSPASVAWLGKHQSGAGSRQTKASRCPDVLE